MSATLVGAIRGLFAIAVIDLDGGGNAEFLLNRGFASVVKTGTGTYVLTLQDSVRLNDSAVALVQAYGTGAGFTSGLGCTVHQNSADFAVNEFTVTIDAKAVLTNPLAFAVQIQDVAPN